MKTYLLIHNNKLFAFEIDNTFIRLSTISKLLNKIDNISDIRVRKMFSDEPADIKIRFNYNGTEYIILEEYDDSSVYWIGPDNKNREEDISIIEKKFSEYNFFW